MKKINISTSSFIFSLGALSGLILLLLRAHQVISFSEVHHVVTSGYEEESLFAMWKYLHGLPIYSDPHQIPFAASYFNWLFYSLYGAFISATVNLFTLDEAWIPTIGRCLTLVIIGMGFWVNTQLFSSKRINIQPLPVLIALSLSAVLWLGPLIGFWAMTVRPDVLALFFDMCAVVYLLKYLPNHIIIGVVAAAMWCYLSWACKQVNIVMPCAIGLFLLVEKRWQAFIIFSVLMGSSYALTLFFANYNLLKTLFFINTAIPFSFDVFYTNLIVFIKKTLPAWFLFIAVFGIALSCKAKAKKVFHDPMVKLSLCGLLAWGLILLPFSSKVGSAENYHFIALFFLLLGIAGALRFLLEEDSFILSSSVALAGILFVTSVGVVLSHGGLASIRKQHEDNIALQQCLSHLPQPIFVVNHYGSLPWMNPSPISFVLAYNYWSDRSANRPFEHNGIGGLIHQGYFNALVLPKYTLDNFDGAPLTNYSGEPQACHGYVVFTKEGKA